jgi:hypothetical protein
MRVHVAEWRRPGGDDMDLVQKREMILEQEANFAASIGSAVIEKPKITCRVTLMPFMFIFLIHDTLKLKSNRRKFQNEFMTERRQAIDIAFEATLSGSKPSAHRMVWKSTCVDTLEKPFSSWIEALVDYYGDLFLAVGDNFKGLVRSAATAPTIC